MTGAWPVRHPTCSLHLFASPKVTLRLSDCGQHRPPNGFLVTESFEDLTSPPGACGVVYTGIIAQHKNACSGGRPKVLQELLWGHKNQLDPGSRACFNADLADQPEAVAK